MAVRPTNTSLRGDAVNLEDNLAAISLLTPTADEKDALAGTSGSPSDTDRYVTDSDPRNTDDRYPTAHATSHEGGTDPVSPAGIGAEVAGAVAAHVATVTHLPEAAIDGKVYARKNGGWVETRGIEVGEIVGFFGSTSAIPVGFALCDGVANSPGPDWSDLFVYA